MVPVPIGFSFKFSDSQALKCDDLILHGHCEELGVLDQMHLCRVVQRRPLGSRRLLRIPVCWREFPRVCVPDLITGNFVRGNFVRGGSRAFKIVKVIEVVHHELDDLRLVAVIVVIGRIRVTCLRFKFQCAGRSFLYFVSECVAETPYDVSSMLTLKVPAFNAVLKYSE